jgi:hypothetical protein
MRGFITYTPYHGDVNNVRLNFEAVAVIAHLLDRRIAIPEHQVRRPDEAEQHGARFRPLHPGHFLDLGKLPVTTLAAVPDGASVYEIPAFEPDTTIIVYEAAPSIEAFAAGRRPYALPAEALAAEVIRLPALLTPFYAMIFGSAATRRRAMLHVRDCVRHHASALYAARHIAGQLGEFHAVVVRRNEFIVAYPEADIGIERIMAHIAEAVPPGSPLLIATDEQDRGFFGPLLARNRCLFARDVVKRFAPSNWTRYQISCVEQNLCALAETFLGTRLSTFSAYINRLRGYHGSGDTRVRFTDGTHRRVRDTEDWPAFSWEPSRRHNQPLWGREFREGWAP